MTADNENEPQPASRRFSVDDARAHAQAAWKKSEFILSRVYDLFRQPKKEWEQIRDEETTVPNILLGYVAPLALIPPVCGALGAYIWGVRVEDTVIRPPLDNTLISIVLTWIVSVALVFVLGIIINTVAENFDADKNDLASQKIAAYSLTPAFMSGIFSLWPPIWWFSLFALAAMAFLMYRGLPILMKAPEDRAAGYAATMTIAALVAMIVLFSLASCAAAV